MGHPERVIVKDVDYVCSSQCSLLVIMEGVQGGDTEGAGLFWQKGDSLCVIVVAMVMAAQNLVGLLAENTVTGYACPSQVMRMDWSDECFMVTSL